MNTNYLKVRLRNKDDDVSEQELANHWTTHSAMVRHVAEELLQMHIGPRCPDDSIGCTVCQKYLALDTLLKSPYE